MFWVCVTVVHWRTRAIEIAAEYHGLFLVIKNLVADEQGSPAVFLETLRAIQQEIDTVEDKLLTHFPKCEEHFQSIDRLNSKEQYERCPISHCPAFQQILNQYQEVVHSVEKFEAAAMSSHARSEELMKDLGADFRSLTVEIIATYREKR